MNSRNGQSLIDILVGTLLGIILIFAAVATFSPALKSTSQAVKTQTAAWLASGMLDSVRVWADGSWHNVLAVATGSGNPYYLITSSSPYVATPGIESIVTATSTYSRYFYVSDVYRTGGSIASSGTSYDPSTKLITVVYGWDGGTTSTISEYLTRNQQNVYDQTDWTGGPNSPTGVATSVNFQYASSVNINYASSPGSIMVTGH